LRRHDVQGWARRVEAANPGAGEALASFRELVVAVHAAAEWHAASVVSVTEGVVTERLPRSGVMTTQEASRVLDVTPAKVCQVTL
jgi:hypothetical protein